MNDAVRNSAIPRLPVLGWTAWSGRKQAPFSCIDELPNLVYTTSGHAAIALALRFLGCRPGDRVLVPTYHCPTMIAPLVRLGAVPVFFPLTASGMPAIDWLEQHAGEARAIVAAHYFGFVNSLDAVRSFCDARGIALIEDCAHAFFGVADGRPVGSWGDVAIASLTKFFPVPEGGCIVSCQRVLGHLTLTPRSTRAELRAAIDMIEIGARYRRFPGLNGLLRALFGTKELLRGRPFTPIATNDHDDVRPPSATDLNDDLLFVAPSRSTRGIARRIHRERIVTLRRRNYALLAQLLADLPDAAPFRASLPDHLAPYVFPLEVGNPEARYRALRAAKVPLFRWDRVWPGTPSIAGDFGAEWATRIFQLACHQDLTEDDLRSIASTVRRIFTELR